MVRHEQGMVKFCIRVITAHHSTLVIGDVRYRHIKTENIRVIHSVVNTQIYSLTLLVLLVFEGERDGRLHTTDAGEQEGSPAVLIRKDANRVTDWLVVVVAAELLAAPYPRPKSLGPLGPHAVMMNLEVQAAMT